MHDALHGKNSESTDEEENFDDLADDTKRLFKKLKNLSSHAQGICASICSMAERQDERYKMVFGLTEPDEYQESILRSVYSNTTGQTLNDSPNKTPRKKRARKDSKADP